MQHVAPSPSPSSSTARTSALKAGLIGLAATQLALGLILAFAPGAFYDALANFGARDDHLLRDNATYYLASAPVLLIAAARPSWRAPVLALVGLQYGLHAINHLADMGRSEPAWVGPFDLVTLAAGAALIAFLLRAALRDEEAGR
jgi:hypothetical protein